MRYPHGFLSAKLATNRRIAARQQPHFRKIGDNALLLIGMVNVFAVRRYKTKHVGFLVQCCWIGGLQEKGFLDHVDTSRD
jgi:hypothetical protein